MDIRKFIELLEKDREFKLQVSGERYIRPVEPRHMKLDIDKRLRAVLEGKGINDFYSHQVKAIELIRQGENVVLMTPTASGKSLAYNIPVLESIMDDAHSASLFIFPLKGLEQDQLRNLKELSDALGIDNAERCTTATQRRRRGKISGNLPRT